MNPNLREVIKVTDEVSIEALTGNPFLYRSWPGKTLEERYSAYYNFVELRKQYGVYPYQRALLTPVRPEIKVTKTWADENLECLNFGSQDNLGLSNHPDVKQAAHDAIDVVGLNSGGSPVLSGKNAICFELEEKIAGILGLEQCMMFPTGWMACFGVLTGLVSHKDTIVMDMLAHNSLDVGARYATDKVYKFKHNNTEDLERRLIFCRNENDSNGLFIVLESLYSMNSDSPDITAVMELAVKYEANVILDVCHDFGCMGENGLGALEGVDIQKYKNRLVIVGSLSKTFVTTGGFLAGPHVIRPQIEAFAPSYTFSTNITPFNLFVASKIMDIVFSEEGKQIRERLMSNVHFMINELNQHGFISTGIPSPIVPVFIGDVQLARIIVREMTRMGVMVNLVEFPAVAKDKTLLRFQLMASSEKERIKQAVEILADMMKRSQIILLNSQILGE